jgi:hypothetical protein
MIAETSFTILSVREANICKDLGIQMNNGSFDNVCF